MLTKFYLGLLKNFIKTCSHLLSIPYAWDSKARKIVLNPNQRRRYMFRALLVIQICYVSVLMYNLVNDDHYTVASKLLGAGIVVVYISGTCMQWNWEMTNSHLQLINGLVQYEKFGIDEAIQMPKKPSLEDKILVFVMKQFTFSFWALPFFMVLFFNSVPCQPPMLASMTENCHVRNEPPFGLLWAGILIFEGVTFLRMGHSWGFYTFYVMSLGVVCILDYISMLSKRNANQSSALQKSNRTRKEFLDYRKMQLLTGSLSICTRYHILPALMFGVCLIQIFAVTVTIAYHAEMPIQGFMYFLLCAVDGILANVVIYTFASKVWSNSQDWKRRLMVSSPNDKAVRRDLQSLALLKLKAGSNFIDQLTALNVQDFCMSQSVSLIIMSKS